jgi:hypothetical protein
MKIIPRFFHGVLDYLVGLFLILAPNLLGFADAGGAAVWVPRIIGLMVLLQALMTDYELGLMKVIPIRLHLMTDYAVGAVLIASPWLFGFSDSARAAMLAAVIAGMLVLGSTAMTQPRGRPREVLA